MASGLVKTKNRNNNNNKKTPGENSPDSQSAYLYQDGKQTQHQALTLAGVAALPQEAILGLPHPGCHPILAGISADKQAWAVLCSRDTLS